MIQYFKVNCKIKQERIAFYPINYFNNLSMIKIVFDNILSQLMAAALIKLARTSFSETIRGVL